MLRPGDQERARLLSGIIRTGNRRIRAPTYYSARTAERWWRLYCEGGLAALERSASRKVGSLNRFIILRADSSLELMQDTQTEPDSGEEADRSSSVSMEDLAWSRRVSGSLRSCGLRRDRRFETAPLGRE
jgi:hypothetical protein